MSWNYRVVRRNAEYGPVYTIHEAYYQKPGDTTPFMISQDEVSPLGDTEEELIQDLKLMQNALDSPIIDWDEWKELIKR